MGNTPYMFPPSQAEYLKAFRKGVMPACPLTRSLPSSVSLRTRMPPVCQQSLRGTCVAAAATALLEYSEDCRTRLSLQYLFEVTKELDRDWVDRNLKALADGGAVDAEFSAVFRVQTEQIRSVIAANGAGSPAVAAFVKAFSDSLAANHNMKSGCLIRRCFEAIERYGICRYSIWPYTNMQVTQMFGGVATATAYPPGAHEDAQKHRVLSGLYLLRAPNNVDEIRGILAGANGRRPMPVCVGFSIFEGCDRGRFDFPDVDEIDGRLASRAAYKGGHEVLLVGYEDDVREKGGGRFLVRNSWGEEWGDGGYGTVPYAYVECFCNEAGTILQDVVDYLGDGYNGLHTVPQLDIAGMRTPRRGKRIAKVLLNILGAAILVAVTWILAKIF